MSHKLNKNAFTLAIGATALAGAMVATTAAANPFEMNTLESGYQVELQGAMGAKGAEGKCGGDKAKAGEGKCGGDKAKTGEGKCGGDKAKAGEGKCGEGKCGMTMMDTDKDGSVSKAEFMAAHEKMFAAKDTNNDGSLSAAEMKAGEGSCGGAKGKKEGKCGEGKCGANKKK